MWDARTDDPANRVEFIFHDLPIEARWSQWRRGAVAGIVVVPAWSFLIWASLGWAGLGPLWVLASVAVGVVTGTVGIVLVLSRLGRYDTPVTPLSYHAAVARLESASPRAPHDVPPQPVAGPSFAPAHPTVPVAVPPNLTRSPYVCDCVPWPAAPDQNHQG